jgi:crotonobetainyl-CoA:carnitine CoA-transferase CaiB-like acyl-CoA transferase
MHHTTFIKLKMEVILPWELSCPQGHPAIIGTQIADLATAWNATIGILIALIHRERTGQGQYIDISYLDCAIALHWILAAELLNHNKISRRLQRYFLTEFR